MASRKIIKSKYFFEEEMIESLAEVPVEEIKNWEESDKLKYVGKALPRVDGYDKVSGTAKYTMDIILSRMVYAKTLRCPHAHAKIKNIDVQKAAQHNRNAFVAHFVIDLAQDFAPISSSYLMG